MKYQPLLQSRRVRLSVAVVLVTVVAGLCPAQKVQVEKVAGFQALAAGEHPRLIVRKGVNLEPARAEAKTEWGQKILARQGQAMKVSEHLAISGRNREVLKEAGFKAAGYAAQYLLTGEAKLATAAAEQLATRLIGYPMLSNLTALDRTSRLHGAALAYDMAYEGWTDAQRQSVRKFLHGEAETLLKKLGGLEASNPPQPEHIAAVCAAGLVELATMGDDPADEGATKRFAAIEKVVVNYLESYVGPDGFDVHGESVRQVAMASGVLPLAQAMKLCLGRDMTASPLLQNALAPLVYQVVPSVGMAITGPLTPALDRSGLFAQAIALTPHARKPAAAWMFYQLNGGKHLGIIRPHQGLYMLLSGMDKIKPARPEAHDAWPLVVQSPQGNTAAIRSGWKGGDMVVLLQGSTLRIVGPGGQFANQPMRHAGIWSHDPGSGGFDNNFSIHAKFKKTPLYAVRQSSRLVKTSAGTDGKTASFASAFAGKARRLTSSYKIKQKVGGKGVEQKIPVAEGGDFSGKRICGVDMSGKSGADGLIVLADSISGIGEVTRAWALHAGGDCLIEVNGATFTINGPDGQLHGVVIQPADAKLAASSNPPYTNFLSLTTKANRVEVVMTVGAKPAVKPGDSLEKGISMGKRKIQLKDDEIRFD